MKVRCHPKRFEKVGKSLDRHEVPHEQDSTVFRVYAQLTAGGFPGSWVEGASVNSVVVEADVRGIEPGLDERVTDAGALREDLDRAPERREYRPLPQPHVERDIHIGTDCRNDQREPKSPRHPVRPDRVGKREAHPEEIGLESLRSGLACLEHAPSVEAAVQAPPPAGQVGARGCATRKPWMVSRGGGNAACRVERAWMPGNHGRGATTVASRPASRSALSWSRLNLPRPGSTLLGKRFETKRTRSAFKAGDPPAVLPRPATSPKRSGTATPCPLRSTPAAVQ